MPIKLNIVARPNPLNREEPVRYYANAVHPSTMGVEELARQIAKRCTLRESDVRGALIALMDVLPDELCKGSIVSFGEIGNFYVNVSSEGANSAAEFTKGNLTGAKVVFQPTKKLKKQLLLIDYSLPTTA